MLPDLAASPCLLYCSLVYSIPRQAMVLRLTQEAGSTSRTVRHNGGTAADNPPREKSDFRGRNGREI